MKILRGRKKPTAREFTTCSSLHLLRPVIECALRHTYQFDGILLFHGVQVINLEEL
jgi:hypothetical protein